MNKALLFFILLVFSGEIHAQPKPIADRIVAQVGENIILLSDVEMAFLQEQAKVTDRALPADAKCVILENLLLEKLFIAQGALDSVVVPEEEVTAELERRVKYFISVFGSREKLEEYYGKPIGELKDEFKDDIESQLISDKVRSKVFTGLKVSPQEVKEYFLKIPKDSIPFFNAEVELGQIVMYPKVNNAQKKISREKLERIKKDIDNGADFSLQAILYSEDPGSSSDGGNLGIIERGELVPDFEAAAYRLSEGQISDVVETPFGFHIIKLDEKRGDKLKLRHILLRPKLTNADVVEVENRMDSIQHLLAVDSLEFRVAVDKFSEDEQSKGLGGMMMNQKTGGTTFEKSEIDGNLIFTIDQMKVGQYSDVLTMNSMERTGEKKTGYRIIYLKSQTTAHRASLEQDYAKIQNAAKAQKQRQLLEKWIDLHKGNAYIKIDTDIVQDCKALEKWATEAKQ